MDLLAIRASSQGACEIIKSGLGHNENSRGSADGGQTSQCRWKPFSVYIPMVHMYRFALRVFHGEHSDLARTQGRTNTSCLSVSARTVPLVYVPVKT